MLRLHLDVRDADLTWTATPTGVARGRSSLEPFRHPALEDFALVSPEGLMLCVRERCAQRQAPNGGVVAVGIERWRTALAEQITWPLQWVTVVVSAHATAPFATFHSGGWAGGPVFLVARSGELWGDWDPARLYRFLSPTSLDPTRAALFIAEFETPYAWHTLFAGLHMLTERAVAAWNGQANGVAPFELKYPAGLEPPAPQGLRPNADVPGTFWEILTSSLRRWSIAREGTLDAALSGGLDSAIVAAAAAEVSDDPVRSYGIRLPDECAPDQSARRLELATRFGLDDSETDIESLLPLAPGTWRTSGGPVVPWEECYYEAADAVIACAASRGARVFLSGFGGDELFGRHWSEDTSSAPDADPADRWPAFLSHDARDALAHPVDRAPPGKVSGSAIEASAYCSSMHMRRGVWAVHPLCSPELVHFCSRLPLDWRVNKALERRLLKDLGCSPQVTDAPVPDDFSLTLVSALRGPAQPLVTDLFRDSLLSELGIVDGDRVRSEYAAWCCDGSPEVVVPFYAAAILELTLRMLG